MNRFSIGTKIAISFSIVLLLMLTICVLTLSNMKKIDRDNTWVVHTQKVLKLISEQLSYIQDAETGQRGFLLTGNDAYLEPYNASVAVIYSELAALKDLTKDNLLQQQNCEKLEELIPLKLNELAQTISLQRSEGFEAAQKIVLANSGKRIMDDIRNVLENMKEEENTLFNKRSESTVATQNQAKVPIYIAMIVALLINILITIYLTRIISNPIRVISGLAENIASKGDLNNKIEIYRKDEIGSLADSFRKMQQTMIDKSKQAQSIADGDLVIDVIPLSEKDVMGLSFQSMLTKLRKQLQDINEGVNVLASSSTEILAAVTQLASSSSETATSVGETTTTVEEVKQTSEVSSHKAKEVSANSKRMADISKEGLTAIANTIEGMNRIKTQMSSIAGMVVKLSEQSQTIGEITATVNEIAEQSNLLAVNAAIEAAKAGEQGKGFTVVAQEIKMLSDRSKEATSQVRTILRDVQKSISSAVMATEEGAKAVEEGLKLTNQSGDSIKTLSESVSDAANAAVLIAASSQQQLEGMDQVVAAMENIKEGSTQSVASTEQTVSSVKDLQKVGQKLDEMMKLYKL